MSNEHVASQENLIYSYWSSYFESNDVYMNFIKKIIKFSSASEVSDLKLLMTKFRC